MLQGVGFIRVINYKVSLGFPNYVIIECHIKSKRI